MESVLESAEAEGRRKALERADLGRLRRLSADVLARATELDREIARLTDQAAQTAEVPEAAEAAATIDDPASDWRPAHPPAYADTTLDDVEASRASLAGAGTGSGATRRRFRRRSRDTGDIPEGVRLAVVQMRLAGEADAAIARYLTEMGVDDPDAVISRIET